MERLQRKDGMRRAVEEVEVKRAQVVEGVDGKRESLCRGRMGRGEQ
jgi:hypothetical protein